jgi:hypothetical protein
MRKMILQKLYRIVEFLNAKFEHTKIDLEKKVSRIKYLIECLTLRRDSYKSAFQKSHKLIQTKEDKCF